MSSYVKMKENMFVSLLFFLSVQVYWFIQDELCIGCLSQNMSKGEIVRFVIGHILLKQVF